MNELAGLVSGYLGVVLAAIAAVTVAAITIGTAIAVEDWKRRNK